MKKFSKTNKIIGGAGILIIFSVILIIGYFVSKPSNSISKEEIFTETLVSKNGSENSLTVEVKGEVKKPDVYVVNEDSRIKDLIQKAGGFTDKANKNSINLAQKLKDEDCIVVESISEDANKEEDSPTANTKNPSGKININKASKEELKTIPGIGDVTAQKIIDYRNKNKRFKTIEEMKNIDRIGEKTFEKIKDKISIR